MEILFVRHGVPDYRLCDERQMTQLEKDYAPLDRRYLDEIKALSFDSEFQNSSIIIASPYTRALQTAELINRELKLELFVEHDLREWRADLNGGYLALQERDRRWHEYRQALKSGEPIASHDYESAAELKRRTLDVLERYQGYRKVIVVSHFNVLESLIGFQPQGIGCGQYYCFNLDDVRL